jgi:hypothetical protein
MPIIEPAPANDDLNQGDILQGIRLFSTADCWKGEGGEAVIANDKFCLVISRPCVAAHKANVTVVTIEEYSGSVPGEVKTFANVVQFLKDTRDGTDSPDVFYLDEIPEKKGTYAARLDSFHNVQVPENLDERRAFLATHRVARLTIEFARDLHLRLFRSFASLGFDDTGWFSDKNLRWVLDKGRVELAEAEKNLREKEAARSQKEFIGEKFPQKQIDEAAENVRQAKEALAPYEAEYAKRHPPAEAPAQPAPLPPEAAAPAVVADVSVKDAGTELK